MLLIGAVLAGAVTALIPMGIVIFPALAAYAMGKTKPTYLALIGGVYAVVAFFVYPWLTAAAFCILCIGISFALYWMQIHYQSNTYTALTLLGISLVALYAMVCLPGILTGAGAFASIQASADAFAAMAREMAAVMPGMTPDAMEQFTVMADSISDMAAAMTVPMLCMASGVIGFANLMFFKLFSAKGKLNITPLRPFRLWAIPKSMTYGMVFLLVASLVMELSGWEYAISLSNTVSILVGMPLMLQGLCVIDFMIVRGGKNINQRRVLIYIAVGLLLWIVQTPLMMLGCFDQLFRFRARVSQMPPMPPRSL